MLARRACAKGSRRMKRLGLVLVSTSLLFTCSTEPQRSFRGPEQRRDALSSGVVISEVYGGGLSSGAAYRYDFVELLNRGTAAIDVSNWSVQYAGATSGAWQLTSLGAFGLLQPGQRLLVRMGTQGSTGMALPTHDVSGGSLMSNSAGIFQVEQTLVRKLLVTPLKNYVSVYASTMNPGDTCDKRILHSVRLKDGRLSPTND